MSYTKGGYIQGEGVLELFLDDGVCGPRSESPTHIRIFLTKNKTKQNKTKTKTKTNKQNKQTAD